MYMYMLYNTNTLEFYMYIYMYLFRVCFHSIQFTFVDINITTSSDVLYIVHVVIM